MSDYSPAKLRRLWEEFREYAIQGKSEGISIHLTNEKELEDTRMYHPNSLIFKHPDLLNLKISRTITY